MDDLWMPIGSLVVIAASVAAAYSMVTADREAWQKFATENKCEVIGYIAPQVVPTTGLDSKGAITFGTSTIPSQRTWKCADGKTYTR